MGSRVRAIPMNRLFTTGTLHLVLVKKVGKSRIFQRKVSRERKKNERKEGERRTNFSISLGSVQECLSFLTGQ